MQITQKVKAIFDSILVLLSNLYTDTYSFEGECLILPGNGANVGEVFYYEGKFEAYQRTYVLLGFIEYPKYVFYHLLMVWSEVNSDKQYGSATNYIRMGNFEDYDISIPPLPTQHRIVEKIEELFSELDNGVENLKKAQKQLKTYRQAVLKDAFEGKLTKEWREQQGDLPTPEELLQQIKAERKAHRQRELAEWEKEVEQWERDGEKGKKPTKPRKSRSVDELSEKELSELHDLPEDWWWGKINDITLRVEYGTSNKSLNEGYKVPVLRMGNMQNGKIDWSDLKYSDDPKDNDRIFT